MEFGIWDLGFFIKHRNDRKGYENNIAGIKADSPVFPRGAAKHWINNNPAGLPRDEKNPEPKEIICDTLHHIISYLTPALTADIKSLSVSPFTKGENLLWPFRNNPGVRGRN